MKKAFLGGTLQVVGYASVWPFLYFDPPTLLRPKLYFDLHFSTNKKSRFDKMSKYRGRSKRVEVQKRSNWCVPQVCLRKLFTKSCLGKFARILENFFRTNLNSTFTLNRNLQILNIYYNFIVISQLSILGNWEIENILISPMC